MEIYQFFASHLLFGVMWSQNFQIDSAMNFWWWERRKRYLNLEANLPDKTEIRKQNKNFRSREISNKKCLIYVSLFSLNLIYINFRKPTLANFKKTLFNCSIKFIFLLAPSLISQLLCSIYLWSGSFVVVSVCKENISTGMKRQIRRRSRQQQRTLEVC